MTDTIKINIVSDVVCPWCVIGYKRLEKAIEELGIQNRIDIQWEPFELNPHIPPEGEELHAHMAKKYAMTHADSSKFMATITDLGAELGFDYDFFPGMKTVSTVDAHILLEYAKEQGKQTELKLRLFKAFYQEQQDVSDREVLKQALRDVGLDVVEAMVKLNDDDFRKQVSNHKEQWKSLGVMSVPTMIFNHESGINGAQPVDVYKQILTDLLENKKVEVLRNVAV